MKSYVAMILASIMIILIGVTVGGLIVSNRISLALHASAAQASIAVVDWETWQTTGAITFRDEADIVANELPAIMNNTEGMLQEMGVLQFIDTLPNGDAAVYVILGGAEDGVGIDDRLIMTTSPYVLQPSDRVYGVTEMTEITPVYVAMYATWDIGHFLPIFHGGHEASILSLQPGLLE